MTTTTIAAGSILAALALSACTGPVERAQAGNATCSVSLPAGCGCPDHVGTWGLDVDVAVDSAANRFVNMGVLPIAPDGSTVLILDGYGPVKLDAAGHVLWQQPGMPIMSAAPDSRDCGSVVTGMIGMGPSDLLGHAVSCSTANCPFVAKLDAAGSPAWVKVYDFGGDGWSTPSIAGVLADGRIALVGPLELGTIDLGNGPISPASGDGGTGVFVALLSPEGDALWTRGIKKQWSGAGIDFLVAGAVSPEGDIAVALSMNGAVDFGDGPLPAPDATVNGGVAIASYDATGARRFGKVVVTGMRIPSLALDSRGDLVITALASGSADFGGGPVGTDEMVTAVAAFDAGGTYLWSTAVGEQNGTCIAVDAANHAWVSADSSVAELDESGALVATHPLGASGKVFVGAIGVAPGGVPVIAGMFGGTLDLAGGALTAQGDEDVFAAALAP